MSIRFTEPEPERAPSSLMSSLEGHIDFIKKSINGHSFTLCAENNEPYLLQVRFA